MKRRIVNQVFSKFDILTKSEVGMQDQLLNLQLPHHAGRALNSDCFLISFIKVVCFSQNFQSNAQLKNIS